jgi:hypothetical protein
MKTPHRILAPLFLALVVLPAQADYEKSSIAERVEGEASAVGYDTVAEALAGLEVKEGASKRTTKDGWIEIEDKEKNVLWSFVPEGHPAYPAVAKRTTSGRGLAVQIDMSGLCEAERSACEKLMKELAKKNEIARNNFIRKPPRGAAAKADVTPIGSLMSAR